MVLRVTEIPKS